VRKRGLARQSWIPSMILGTYRGRNRAMPQAYFPSRNRAGEPFEPRFTIASQIPIKGSYRLSAEEVNRGGRA